MIVEFTMLNQGKVILCAISTAAMDDLEGRRDVRPDQRVDQFMRLRKVIEERAARKLFEEQAQADRPVVLRPNVVGRIFKAAASPVETPWMWTLHHEDRSTHGYEATREAAMAAFAKSWRRE
jgi:hypothetical protein